MENYSAEYSAKLVNAGQIAALVKDNWVLGMDEASAQTPLIMSAIAQRVYAGELKGIKVQTLLDVYPFDFYRDKALSGLMTGVSWFSSAGARNAVNGGWADLIPSYYRDIPGHIRENYEYDAFCIQVSPMDKHGFFSLGAVSSYSPAMIDKARRIFVEVNKFQPRTVCCAQLHISEIDAITENHIALPVLPKAAPDEISLQIGKIIAEHITDGACLQLGIGAVPDAVGMALKSKHDLGIHTELFTDSMVELISCGAVNNSKKRIHRKQSVTTFAYGSKRIYDYIDDNPSIAILPVEYVNDPCVISQNDNVVSVNAAVEVDLLGQVCAESIGTRHLSGTGGQADFVRGACQSKGGKSFIAMASSTKDGSASKIVSCLKSGAVCTTSKNDVDYVVTEYGVAHLRGQSVSSRARQLIAIAHPDFRDELSFEARKRGMMI